MARLETASYVKISLIIVVALLLFSFVGFGSCSSWNPAAGLTGNKAQMGSSLVDAASVENLEIDWASGSVDIIVDPQATQIEFSETSYGTLARAQEMRWELSGKTLKIYYGGWFSCSALSAKDLSVRIPASYAAELGNITIQGASGNYHMEGLTCENLTVKLASGEVKALDMKVNEVNLEVASGQVLVDGRVSNKIRTDVASGSQKSYVEMLLQGLSIPDCERYYEHIAS